MTPGIDWLSMEESDKPMAQTIKFASLSTTFLAFSMPLHDSPLHLRDAIEAALRSHGEPLRWAVTAIDPKQRTVQIEAVITQGKMDVDG